ncbi:cysteine hydrolase [Pusillimonas sp. CC-YST705]|uniref:Cysteine hydrolase n=1 Tax=Mesopusillimonas faecipullorum TaxID=2755040 RepID=A0ABS8CC45_9BURK|nr:isochorismatase family cysteine hydrolase [Mesopusillimonas faecipullorum]MCB5363597.1 cysteine hydrolase [Mesopusillimonas faecipullorum]
MHKIQLSPKIVERSRQHRGRDRILQKLEARRCAHLIVDMQVGFLAPGAAVEIPMAREIVGNINRCSQAVREAGGLNVFLRYTYDEHEPQNWTFWYDVISSPEAKEGSRGAFTRGNEGFELWPELDVSEQDLIVDKTRFSAFVPGTCELDKLLREKGIDTVIVSGTMTNCCSESTARDAAQRNYQVVFLADANATLTDEEHNATLNNIQSLFGEVLTVDQVCKLLSY